jgi:hypothetical protein
MEFILIFTGGCWRLLLLRHSRWRNGAHGIDDSSMNGTSVFVSCKLLNPLQIIIRLTFFSQV